MALSSACSFAAYAASSSSTLRCFLCFLAGGLFSGYEEISDSSAGERFLETEPLPSDVYAAALVFVPFVASSTVAIGSAGSVVPPFPFSTLPLPFRCSSVNLSKRRRMSSLTASWISSTQYENTQNIELGGSADLLVGNVVV
jgi:hypothetical protein